MDVEQVVMEVHDVDGRLAEVVSLLMMHEYTLAVESLENCPAQSFMVWARRPDSVSAAHGQAAA